MVNLLDHPDSSADNPDFFVAYFERVFKRTNNPLNVWNAILRLNECGRKTYPSWICEYLVRSAENLKKCDHTPKGENGIVAAFGLKGTFLYEKKI